MAGKAPELSRNGHELAPLNNARNGPETGKPGVTIVLQGPRGSIISRGSNQADGDPDRAAWSGKMQFFLSIIGYSVGLGNIWRFPYLCQQNGGGAFLIPFAVMLILEGIPLFLIELGIGQKMRLGSLGVWNTIHPWLGGIGISSCLVTFFVALYYNVIITWCFYYFFNSFQYPLPWEHCPRINGTVVTECDKSSATAYYWYRVTLDASPSIEDPGMPKWWIVLCLLLSWVVVFFIVMKGIQSSGKVVYFTSMFPYIVLTIFFVRGITLPGAGAGVTHMLTPKVEKLLDPKVWLDAATQVFYSFGLAFGSLIAFGSYNTPKNNCVRDVILVSVCNAITAIYASVVIFAILGFKAVSNVNKCIEDNKILLMNNAIISKMDPSKVSDEIYENAISKVNSTLGIRPCSLARELDAAAEGTGLAFIVFTQAIVELPGAPFWAVIFFMMLLSLGIGSQIGILEGMLCTVFDIEIFKRISKQYVTATVCIICFSVGIIFTTGAGEYWLSMFDSFAGTIGLVVVALLEMISVVYVYGHEKFTKDIQEMTGVKPGLYWQISWRYLAPGIMVVILVSSIISMSINHPSYAAWSAEKGDVVNTPYPGWVLAIAISMVLAGILPIPIVFLLRRYQCLKMDINIHEGSIRRIDTTVSTKEMITDVDEQLTSPDGPCLTATNTLKNKFTIGDFEV
ncbi:sodium-dependent neutral amino acid transporter B(0)AT3 isoform X2 [Aethina tumida]|uniref:sodium-dependent neutral amino acid transporter B(0)AT3 isoform X2 n=1 Tax=Aethina tumida TaxID=116153 RepID=UPI00214923EE|nr:sodium-dependent neutral amino acid transporter B(0)AT3 isoform X2 [Aethina tumida]XP_049817350.1 sodium-dependent neutral amino acid transporter B(0)AT3 isoform X2 [Aethina tumida]